VIAFLVDSVDRIERCSWQQFEPLSETACDSSTANIVGTVRLPDGIVLIIDLETVMGAIDPTMKIEHYEERISAGSASRAEVTIVHCDDSTIVQKMVHKTLGTAGFPLVKSFTTGAQALEFLQTAKPGEVDVILSDIEMPVMDGLSLCRQVREIGHLKSVPFFFFSSMIDTQMAAKCRTVGGDGSFSKPEIHLLVAEIDRLVARRRIGAAAS
jgi:two-component system chemotaxis response regulator CheV